MVLNIFSFFQMIHMEDIHFYLLLKITSYEIIYNFKMFPILIWLGYLG